MAAPAVATGTFADCAEDAITTGTSIAGCSGDTALRRHAHDGCIGFRLVLASRR